MSQQTQTADLAGATTKPAVLASDADRDAATALLTDAFAAGRLTLGEHEERVRAACAARTRTELAELTADLPVPAEAPGSRPAFPRGVDWCLVLCCPPVGIARLLAAWRGGRRAEDR